MASIEQIRADVAQAEALLDELRQTIGVLAGVSFGDMKPGRVGDGPDEDAMGSFKALVQDASGQLREVVSSMPWLVTLTDEERARLQANAPSAAQREAMREIVTTLGELDPEEFDSAALAASVESGVVLTRAVFDKLRDDLERMDLVERLQARIEEILRLFRQIQQGEEESARREREEAALRAGERN